MAIGFSPSAAIGSPHRRPCFLPTGGREAPHHHGLWLAFSGQGHDPFAGGGLSEAVAVGAVGDKDVGVVQEPVDGRGRQVFGGGWRS